MVKTPLPDLDRRFFEAHCQDMRLEARIYDAVGAHPRIPRIVSWDPETCCLTMEYLENGTLKDYITTKSESLTPQLRLRWTKQASEGLSVLHGAGVIYCDISLRNFLLDGDLHLKIADFGGSSLAGSAASDVAGTRFRYPVSDWDAPARFEEDVFGLGSLVYSIMTDEYPYKDIPSHVEELYGSRTFPDITERACGDIVTRCWEMQVSAADVHAYFEARDGKMLVSEGLDWTGYITLTMVSIPARRSNSNASNTVIGRDNDQL